MTIVDGAEVVQTKKGHSVSTDLLLVEQLSKRSIRMRRGYAIRQEFSNLDVDANGDVSLTELEAILVTTIFRVRVRLSTGITELQGQR